MTPQHFPRALLLLLAIIGLSACGSDNSQSGTATPIGVAASALKNSLGRTSKPAPGGIGMTRATLANIVTPVDLVTIETSGAQGVIAKIGTNRGVETWSSVDNKTLSMRDGVIIATRGLGADLMSADVPQLMQLRSGQPFTRRHVILSGEDKPITSSYFCHPVQNGPKSIVVVERSYPTQHVTEQCNGPDGGFSNDYWFDVGGKLRRSRQFVSENVGFVVIEHLR